MKRILGILAAVSTAAAGVGVWTYHHPPFHLPSPILDNPLLFQAPPPNSYVKVISLASCVPMQFEGTPVPAYGATLTGSSNSIANGGSANLVYLYCDAQLPAQAVAFDYAELEYAAPNFMPYVPGWSCPPFSSSSAAPPTPKLSVCPESAEP